MDEVCTTYSTGILVAQYEVSFATYFSRCIKLDAFSESLDAILKEHFTALVMRGINSTLGFEESKKSLIMKMRNKYEAIMLGQNEFEELYSNYPLWYEHENKVLMWYDADWLANFSNPLETESGRLAWELILNCTQMSEKLPKWVNNFNMIKGKKFHWCFEHHATEDVKAAVDGAGEYHKFMIAMAFKEESDQVQKH